MMANVRNDGTQLERIVELLERMKTPPGFTIERRHKVYQDGEQIAELDIVISGFVGTTVETTTLIECRDRPSEGAAPVSWIEQLAGRRDRLRLDSVVAVSSTGFSPAAISYGREKNIRLRTLADLNDEEMQSWIPDHAPIIVQRGRYLTVRVGFKTPGDHVDLTSTVEPPEHRIVPFQADDKCFLRKDSGEAASLLDLWQVLLNTHENTFFGGLLPGGPKRQGTVHAGAEFLESLSVILPDGPYDLIQLEFDAEFWIESPTMQLVGVKEYSGDDRQLGVVARWGESLDGSMKGMSIILIPKKQAE
jgi:hypothetical protein